MFIWPAGDGMALSKAEKGANQQVAALVGGFAVYAEYPACKITDRCLKLVTYLEAGLV